MVARKGTAAQRSFRKCCGLFLPSLPTVAVGRIDSVRREIDNARVPAVVCVECREAVGSRSVLICADCGGLFHFPDARISEPGTACGVHVIGFRNLLGRDVVPFCLRCDMAFRLKFGVPS